MKKGGGKIGFGILFIMIVLYEIIIYVVRSSFSEGAYSLLLILGVVAAVLLARAFIALLDSEQT